ncbi:RagB/SusD family nutrient uptake outer membrane protein [Pedobacter frigidisoli]|uniref:RagB/SusD family nutrient uptake outer membrane protein n=1 Tax=Pedobacter frigidisoli TaxID=2530455 RepID=UPI0029307FC4|nr:RagB/SusD family nutrient uptake outer membrane protein [Pedobacter frigidisoli]
MKKIFYLAILTVLAATGCRKYVEIDQIGVRTPKYTSDYRALMNNNSELEFGPGYPILSGDDTEINDATRQNNITDIWANTYTWSAKHLSETQGDVDWERQYKNIYICNEVISGVLASEGGTESVKQQIYAEALVHRAYAYQTLLNMYSRQYNATTASSDLGVPLLLTPNLYASLNRAPVEAVYSQVIGDLKASVSKLPALADYNVRPAKVSAYALLARTFLNKREFSQAALYADSALLLRNTLLDLKTYSSAPSSLPKRLSDPEILLSKNVTGSFTAIPISSYILNLLGTNDLRYSLFTNTRGVYGSLFSTAFTGRAYWRYALNGEFLINIGPSVPEMMLIKAECLARAGNTSDALALVNNLRKKRFTDANYSPLTSTDASDALRIVIEERKREFFGKGFRWLDQRRLNQDSAFAITVSRVFKGNTFTLEPNSNRYVYPIGDKYILLNPEIEQNPR